MIAGVAIDNWKKDKAEKALRDENYTIKNIFPLGKHVTIIQVEITNEEVIKLQRFLKRMEINLKQSN